MQWTNQPQTLMVPWWVWQGLNLRPPPCEGKGPTPIWRFPWVSARTRCQSVYASFRACSSRSAQLNQGELSMTYEPDRCGVCNGLLSWRHDHRDDFSGLDDGPYRERKKTIPKPAHEISEIRARAWATRRQKYGQRGHR